MRVDMGLQQHGSIVVDMAAVSYAYHDILEASRKYSQLYLRDSKKEVLLSDG